MFSDMYDRAVGGVETGDGIGGNWEAGLNINYVSSVYAYSDGSGRGDGYVFSSGYSNGYGVDGSDGGGGHINTAFLQLGYITENAYAGGSEGGGGDGSRDNMGNCCGFGNSYATGSGQGDGDGNGYSYSYGHNSPYGCIGNNDNG